MRKAMLAVLLAVTVPAWAGTPLPEGPHIVISGEGDVSVAPQRARITLSFEQRAAQPLLAKQAADQAVSRYLAVLPGYNVGSDDITASDLSAQEEFDYDGKDRRVSRGFVASRSVTVVLDELERLNELLDAGLKAGASAVESVNFEAREADALRAQAKAKAVETAQRKARETAAAFGVRLGKVYSIDSVNSRQSHVWGGDTFLNRVQVGGSRLPVRYLQPQVKFTESVSAVFELER